MVLSFNPNYLSCPRGKAHLTATTEATSRLARVSVEIELSNMLYEFMESSYLNNLKHIYDTLFPGAYDQMGQPQEIWA